tara:strand:- start:3364 stop:3984 length:621 start_codon:yes stop_codon:yes gene_type:complete
MWYSDTLGVIRTPREFSYGGKDYPRQVFRKFSKAQLLELGIRPARVTTPDSRYHNTGKENYNVAEDGEMVISYDSIEKNVDDLKKQIISAIKQNVAASLASSDWRVLREADGGTAMTAEWKTYRNETRSHGNALESGVESFASLDAVKNFQNHSVIEVRKTSTYDDEGNETIGPETEDHSRTVDKTTWDWPAAPDDPVDPYHVEYK